MSNLSGTRRAFLQSCAASAAVALTTGGTLPMTRAAENASPDKPGSLRGRIYKSAKWGMIGTGGSILDRFQVMRELGYHGMELNSPGDIDRDECLAAARETNMPIHGVVNSIHWQQRLSSPDPAVRETGLKGLLTALEDSAYYGGSSVLLVPGAVRGEDETHDDVWQRSIVEIRKALPTAARLGVRILIENVWNGFCEQPERMRDYIDEIDNPWVGAYFDIGNCRRFGAAEDWIRTLGRRIVKLDVKDWSAEGGFGKIGEGAVDWAAVREALGEIGFSGWATAEVAGGGRERLAEISANIDKVFDL